MGLHALMCNNNEQKIIQKMLDDFCELTGLAAVINDCKGAKLSELSHVSNYCKIMRSKGDLCCLSDERGAKIAVHSKSMTIYICHAGLVDLAIPIYVEGEHIGSIMAGQVRCRKKLVHDFSSNMENLFEMDARLEEYYEEIPYMNLEQLERSSRVLEIICNYITERLTHLKSLRERSSISEEHETYTLYRKKCGLLSDAIRCVDYTKSTKLLRELYTEFIDVNHSEIDQQLYKQLFVAELRVLDIPIPTLDEVMNYEKSALLISKKKRNYYTKLVDHLFEDIILKKRFRVADELDYAIAYTQRFYNDKMNVADVAKIVNLSPDYFARLFKRRVGSTFVDYLKIRKLDSSKYLLKNTNLSIGEIAQMIGYDESNYFTRVFKKQVGVSPSRFREENVS